MTCGPVPVRTWERFLGEGHIADVVQAVLDRPVPTEEIGQSGGAGLGKRKAGDRIEDHGPPPPGAQVAGLTGDLDDLGGVREAEPVDGDGLEGTEFHTAVGAVAGAIQDRDSMPGQAGAAGQERGLVGLDHKQIVRLLDGDEELGRVGVGLERVGRDHDTGQLQVGQERLEAGDFTGGAVDLSLGQHRTGSVVHRGQQVDLPAVAPGTAQRLAVDRDPPPPLLMAVAVVAVGKPSADRCGQHGWVHAREGPADRGLGRHHPAVGAITTSAERGPDRLRGVSGPLGDRGHRPGTGQDRGGGDGKDRDQRMPAAATGTRVSDRGEVGEQLRPFGRPERGGVGELGEGSWDEG